MKTYNKNLAKSVRINNRNELLLACARYKINNHLGYCWPSGQVTLDVFTCAEDPTDEKALITVVRTKKTEGISAKVHYFRTLDISKLKRSTMVELLQEGSRSRYGRVTTTYILTDILAWDLNGCEVVIDNICTVLYDSIDQVTVAKPDCVYSQVSSYGIIGSNGTITKHNDRVEERHNITARCVELQQRFAAIGIDLPLDSKIINHARGGYEYNFAQYRSETGLIEAIEKGDLIPKPVWFLNGETSYAYNSILTKINNYEFVKKDFNPLDYVDKGIAMAVAAYCVGYQQEAIKWLESKGMSSHTLVDIALSNPSNQ